MSGRYGRNEDDMAYGEDYNSSRGYGQQGGQQGDQSGQDRGIIGDTFKKFKSKYDQYQGQKPPQDYGYGSNPSTSTVGSQQYGGSGHAGGLYNQQQGPQQSGQPAYPGGPPQQKPQKKPDLADKLLGGLIGSVASIGHDVEKIVGGSHGQKPPHGQAQYPGTQSGFQSNLQSQTQSGPTEHRFDSTFAGLKSGNDVKWYVDGCSYMWAVSQALESARQTIWILDWWLSPELYLRRPPARNEEWRIDKVLQRAANRGVKVNIIVYKEVTQVLTLSSAHTKHALEALSPNIGVFRHPDHLPDAQTTHSSILSSLQGLKLDAAGASKLGADALKGIYGITGDVILYWAHHEKLCLIDGQTAFMGGLDLCFGRWDVNQHPIADAHPSDLNKIVFPGQDYNNARNMDFSEVNHPFQNKLDRTKSSRMGWSDISICLRGPSVGDLMHHFVDRWNFIYDEKYNVRSDKRYQRLPNYPEHRDDEGPKSSSVSGQQGSQVPNQSYGQQSTQFAPPPQAAGYTPPAWQGSSRPTSSAGGPAGLTTSMGQNYSPQSGYNQPGQGQQNFPPPPPGGPPMQEQYGQPQHQGSIPPSSQESGHYGSYQYQPGFPPPPAQAHSQYGLDQQQSGFAPPPSFSQSGGYAVIQQETPYAQRPHSPQPLQSQGQYGAPHQEQSYGQRPYSPQPPSFQGQYGSGQQSQNVPPPPVSPQPGQQSQYSQRPVIPPVGPEAQVASQQYAAYTGSQAAGMQGSSGPQGPAELGNVDSPQYQPYHGQPTARGFDDPGDYDPRYSGERGFDDDYDYARGDERAFGRKPGVSPSRFDRYKEEARRFQQEGRVLGHDVGRYGDLLESKIDDKMAQHSGGRFGRPQSAAGGMSCQLVRSCTKWSNGTATEHSVQNAYIDLIQNSKHFIYIENQFFITATGDKQKPVKNMIGKALVERIIRASREQTPFKIIVNIPSVPAFAGDLVGDASLGTRAIMEFQYSSICRGGHSIMEEVAKAGINPMDYIRFYNLRNYDRLNVTPAKQQAEQQSGMGYEDARLQYESQLGSGYGGYGETQAPPGGPGLMGPQQLYGGQQGQYHQSAQQGGYGGQQSQSQFAPPPQQGAYGSQRGPNQYPSSPQQGSYAPQQGPQYYNQYQQAAQGVHHVWADDWDSVSSCYMLGGKDIRNVPWSGPTETELDAFVSEELYIHSKVMIVDDQTVVCGSANLNDRSMLGTHDSEIALVVSDPTPVQSTMAGRPWQASRFAASLRRQLFRKHLGLLRPQDMQRPDDNFMPVGVPNAYDWGTPEDNIVSDPLSGAFQSLWNTRARTNTEVFRKAFRAVPDDTVKNWKDYKEFYEYYFAKANAQAGGGDEQQKSARVEYGHVVGSDFPGGVKQLKDLLSQVKGTLVEMPLCFLQEEDIAKEGLSFNPLTAEVYT
ncbi:hypothetical protein LTR70_006032 [Exophiala xenobiotica]|uniref:phospholipase D n=1 Tax=Lithohypha guttulata TaxID=1690604 RepID=A0ABR0KAU9_9EURO|nr:hypothetical protein LTR24_004776 [Lithohypha guttulata]KAK5317001.1 hypothetical protein LTR70_006032 [Exophiala xenobiotica]